ncbi:MAG TPA: hypothetical protein VG269_03345 [Tepidisphaeraceae bacterium]|jgi:hypothetical protein|nr:hypothetical protein [Tepidisphaeraceae bacterium]
MQRKLPSMPNAVLAFLLAISAGFSWAGPTTKESDPFTGEWGWAIGFKGLAVPVQAKFTRNADKLNGGVRFGNRKPLPIIDGKIEGRKITFQVEDKSKESAILCKYTGELKDGKITGKLRLSIPAPSGNGEESELDWEAQRMQVPINW